MKSQRLCFDKAESPNSVLTQALSSLHSGGVDGVGGLVTPTTYFHSMKRSNKGNKVKKLSQENKIS